MGTGPDPSPSRARLGRPRVSDVPASADPRDDILDAAAELFGAVGYAKATTREIAARAGLRQSSLFYHFATKEDILAALFERIVAGALDLTERLGAADLPPAEHIYSLVFGDVHNMMSSERNLAVLPLIGEAQTPRFEAFWADYRRLHEAYRDCLRRGMEDGTLVSRPLDLATDLILGMVDGVSQWFSEQTYPAADLAREIADVAARYVLTDTDALPTVRSSAVAFLAETGSLGPPDDSGTRHGPG